MHTQSILCSTSDKCFAFSALTLLVRRQEEHPFNGLFSRTTSVSRYQKGKTSLDLWGKRWWGFGTAVASAGPYANNLHLAPDRKTTPTPHDSNFYRLDALPDAQPTVSKHWRLCEINCDACRTNISTYKHIALNAFSTSYKNNTLILNIRHKKTCKCIGSKSYEKRTKSFATWL